MGFWGSFLPDLSAQVQPYLLLQGPNDRTTYRFQVGQQLEWRLAGEEELFSARITALYPEAQSIRLDDLLLSLESIASVRFVKKGAGLRRYLQVQGIFNLGVIGIASAAGGLAEGQQTFASVTAAASALMVTLGSVGRRRQRELGANSRFILQVAGGDLRLGDDPNRGY